MSNILGIFAKQPCAGQVKTRLADATSPAWAQRVAQAFLEDTLDRFQGVAANRVIAFTPASASSFFAALAAERYAVTPQSDGDLGQRLQHFFALARQQGGSRIVAIGADSPTLPVALIEQAFQLLECNDTVIGPACDGGYYLIGCWHKEFPIFDAIPWSTPRVLAATIERLQSTSARLALLPPWYDVDTVDDWAFLCGHLRAMRAAGIDPGVPCVERLIAEQPS